MYVRTLQKIERYEMLFVEYGSLDYCRSVPQAVAS